jgi:hypothetical protein
MRDGASETLAHPLSINARRTESCLRCHSSAQSIHTFALPGLYPVAGSMCPIVCMYTIRGRTLQLCMYVYVQPDTTHYWLLHVVV